MMAKLYINGLIGSKSNEELELAFEYLNKAISLGNIAAINTLGLMYQNGTYPVKKNIKKAIGLFEQVTNKDYPYAYNNLGLIYEAKGNIQKSFKFFTLSSSLGESTEFLKYISIFTLADIRNVILNVFINPILVVLSICITIIFMILAMIRYEKKELV